VVPVLAMLLSVSMGFLGKAAVMDVMSVMIDRKGGVIGDH
jgi:hypothetical protein